MLSLSLPNLIPRACAVDIHEETEINYIDGESEDNIVFESVVGFEVCDQFGNEKNFGLKMSQNDGFYQRGNGLNTVSILIAVLVLCIGGFLMYFLLKLTKYLRIAEKESVHKIEEMIVGLLNQGFYSDEYDRILSEKDDDNEEEYVAFDDEYTPLLA